MTGTTKLRLRFAKRGDLRLVSHHDLLRCLERMLRRAAVPMALSEGFNPRPRITFALALGLGIEACREVVDLKLTEPITPSELLRRLAAVAPPGFDWVDARPLALDSPPPRPSFVEYELPVPAERREVTRAALANFLSSTSWSVVCHRGDRQRTLDLRAHVLAAELPERGPLSFRLKIVPDGSARPEDVLEALRLRDLLDGGAFLTRTDIELEA
jgi:radical SAM-linked protein